MRSIRQSKSHRPTIVLIGLRHWCERIAEILNEDAGDELTVDTVFQADLKALLRAESAHTARLFLRVGYRPGSRTWRGRLMDSTWLALKKIRPKSKFGFYWIGTDVLDTLRDHRIARLTPKFEVARQQDAHFAGSPRLVEELASIGLGAKCVYVPTGTKYRPTIAPLPKTFSVLTYIPDKRFSFYGGEPIYAAAKALPFIPFHVVAGIGAWVREPLANLHFHGWATDMERYYANSTCVVRLVEHDSLGATVTEGLMRGRHIVYSYSFPHTVRVAHRNADDLIDRLSALARNHHEGTLLANSAGSDYAWTMFNRRRLVNAFVQAAKEAMDG